MRQASNVVCCNYFSLSLTLKSIIGGTLCECVTKYLLKHFVRKGDHKESCCESEKAKASFLRLSFRF